MGRHFAQGFNNGGFGPFFNQEGFDPREAFAFKMHGHHHRGGGRRGGRLFDYGELRLLVLALIAEQPAHGYELIKAIEERFGGAYSPSPGVIYPTLSWLEDEGYARVEQDGSRKSYSITPEGEAFLAENRAAADALFERAGDERARGARGRGRSNEIMRAMENLKTALRLRLREGIDPSVIDDIAAAIDAAAQTISKGSKEASE
jgi:DNA-binding PadR family transcriptional regulator